MTHDDDVGVHGLDGEGGVVKRLAFFDAAAAARHVYHVGAEDLSGLLERHAGAGAGLVEQSDDALAPQCGDLLDVAAQDLAHHVGVLQNGLDLGLGEVVEVEHVPAGGGVRLRARRYGVPG